MKIYLLYAPPLKRQGSLSLMFPPLGVLYLAAYVRERHKGIEFKVGDGYKLGARRAVQEILDFSPDILGVSFGTQSATGAYAIINEVKERSKNTLIVCGGPHPTCMPEEPLQRSKADFVVMGEGEETFLEIVQHVLAGEPVSGIVGTAERRGEEIAIEPVRPLIRDIDSIPFPARDLLDIGSYPGFYYKKARRDTNLMSGRGCPHRCTFCSNPVWKETMPFYRLRSPQSVVDEAEMLKRQYGVEEIYDLTDTFNGSLRWSKLVCDEYARRNLGVSLKAQMNAVPIDDELASKMKAAGFWLSLLGVESANDRTLKGIKKNVTSAQIERSMETLKRHGIKVYALLMAFNAWEEDGHLEHESVAETRNTLSWAKRLIKEDKMDFMSWSLTTPFPGSALYDLTLKHKLIPSEMVGQWEQWDSTSNFVLNLDGVREQDWLELKNEGTRLEALILLKSGSFNLAAAPLYAKRGLSLVSREFRSRWNRVKSMFGSSSNHREAARQGPKSGSELGADEPGRPAS